MAVPCLQAFLSIFLLQFLNFIFLDDLVSADNNLPVEMLQFDLTDLAKRIAARKEVHQNQKYSKSNANVLDQSYQIGIVA